MSLTKKDFMKYGTVDVFEKTPTDIHIKITDGFSVKNTPKLTRLLKNNFKEYNIVNKFNAKNCLFECILKTN